MDKSDMSRELVVAVGGPQEAADNRKSYLARVAERAGLSVRVVKAAFYGEQLSRKTRRQLTIAAGQHEAETLAMRFDALAQSLRVRDPDFHCADIDAMRAAARVLRGLVSSGTDGEG